LWWVFWDRVSRTVFPGWLQTTVLLISVSWVARITGMSHWYLACLKKKNKTKIGSYL
jgi:hypothetical protein